MTQCAVIGLVDENWEHKNYIEFSEYRKDIKKLEDENRKLKDIEAELLKEKKELLDKVETLELWLDMKEKLNEEYRKQLGKMVMTPYWESICSRVSLEELEQAKKDIEWMIMNK